MYDLSSPIHSSSSFPAAGFAFSALFVFSLNVHVSWLSVIICKGSPSKHKSRLFFTALKSLLQTGLDAESSCLFVKYVSSKHEFSQFTQNLNLPFERQGISWQKSTITRPSKYFPCRALPQVVLGLGSNGAPATTVYIVIPKERRAGSFRKRTWLAWSC